MTPTTRHRYHDPSRAAGKHAVNATDTLLSASSMVLACSCNYPEEWTEELVLNAYCRADVVFEGEVESALEVRRNFEEYKIWPRKTFKGKLASPAYAVSEFGGRCGYQFRPGGKYLIFAFKEANTQYLRASSCGLTGTSLQRQFMMEILESQTEHRKGEICDEEAIAARERTASDKRIDEFLELLQESRDVHEQD